MATETQIRRCSLGDDEALALIGQATFLETFAGVLSGRDILTHCAKAHSIDLYRSWLVNTDYKLWLAELQPGNAPVGFMVTATTQLPLPDVSARDLKIKRTYMLGKFQGDGLGKRLAMEAIADSRARKSDRLLLGVYAHDDAALRFHARMGFQKLGKTQVQRWRSRL